MHSREGSAVICRVTSGVMTTRLTPIGVFNSIVTPLRCFMNGIDSMCWSGKSRKCLTEGCQRLSYLFWKIFHTVFLDKRMIVFLILLQPMLSESLPTHQVRHRHLRHALNDRTCDKPQIMENSHNHECRRLRVRRDIDYMNVREGENSTMCDYRVCVDKNPNRVPKEIRRVLCVELGCRCLEEGSFRCTQLTETVNVEYRVGQGQSRVDRLEVEKGCVCASRHGHHLGNFNPSVSVDK